MKDTKIQTCLVIRWNKHLSNKLKFLLLIFALTLLSFAKAQDLRDHEHTLKFADYLFKTQQFTLASEEYERAVYQDSTNSKALLKLLQSYRYSEKFGIAKQRFNYFFGDSLYNIRVDFAEEYVKQAILRNEFKSTFEYLEKNNSLPNDKKETYQLGSVLLQKKWDDAFTYALKHPVTNEKKNADLHVIAFNAKQLKYKKPFVAALFSTIVPGTGKMYTKNWKDGVISLLFVGVNAWQAYRGFDQYGEKSVYGWVFASISTSFYLGNIFGSHKSAKKYNKKLDDEVYHNTWHLMVDDF